MDQRRLGNKEIYSPRRKQINTRPSGIASYLTIAAKQAGGENDDDK